MRLRTARDQLMRVHGFLVLAFCLSNVGCTKCTTDAECDDGRFCDGTEWCGVDNFGMGPRCLEALDPCRNPTPVCDEAHDTCHPCTTD